MRMIREADSKSATVGYSFREVFSNRFGVVVVERLYDMHDLVDSIERWVGEGKRVALATVVETWGSAPRPLGSKMAVSSAGDMAGSVSGGCVEGAVLEKAREVLAAGVPQLLRFGVTNEEAWAVGLSCGGEIEVFVEELASRGEGAGDA